jgi:hypothetical protein
MTGTASLTTVDQEEERILSPTDIKHWEVVQKVLSHLRKDECTTTQQACKEAGVSRSTYYAALANPVVQQLRLQQMIGTAAAAQHLMEKTWLPVIAKIAALARSGDSRESVAAARFLRDVYIDIERGLGPGVEKQQGEESDAAKAIRSFLGGRKVLLRQTTTTQEVEVEEDISDGNLRAGAGS